MILEYLWCVLFRRHWYIRVMPTLRECAKLDRFRPTVYHVKECVYCGKRKAFKVELK